MDKTNIPFKVVFTPPGELRYAAQVGATATIEALRGKFALIRWDKDNPLVYGQMDGEYFVKDFSPFEKCDWEVM